MDFDVHALVILLFCVVLFNLEEIALTSSKLIYRYGYENTKFM